MIDEYLERIGYDGPREPSEGTLRALQRSHLQTVPFENLDILAGRGITLTQEAIIDKIVRRRCGGFCYELNGSFAWLLRALGFQVTMLSARPSTGAGGLAPEFAHLTLRVDLEERWLADVGFGDSFFEPLRLDEEGPQLAGGRQFSVSHEEDDWTMEHHFDNASGREFFRFTLEPRSLEDFVAQCRVYSTAPDSSFRRGRVVTRATPDGRVTLSDHRLIVVSNGQRREEPIEDEATFAEALQANFDLTP